MNATDKILEKIKDNKLVAVTVAGAVCLLAVIAFLERTLSFYDTHLASDLKLVSMNLDPASAAIFSDGENLSCRLDQSTLRSFAPKDEHQPGGRLGLVFTFANEGSAPAVISMASFEVDFVESLAGGGAGVVESTYTYELSVDFETGEQRFPLAPNYQIPRTETGAFTLALSPSAPGIGQCWIARIVFDTTAGRVASETFQMILSRE